MQATIGCLRARGRSALCSQGSLYSSISLSWRPSRVIQVRSFRSNWRPKNLGVQRSWLYRLRSGMGDNVVHFIIGANALVFGGWWMSERNIEMRYFMTEHFTLSPTRVFHRPFRYGHTIVTSFFSHAHIWHFAANMVTLFFFGPSSVMILGPWRFLGLYLTGGIFSNLCYMTSEYLSVHNRGGHNYGLRPFQGNYSMTLGASGAVNSILINFCAMFPAHTIYIMVVPVPAILAGLAFISKDLYEFVTNTGGRTNNIGHLGGAFVGLSYFLATRGRGNPPRI